MIELRGMRGSTTAPLLAEQLAVMGVQLGTGPEAGGIVSYGVAVNSPLPTLNAAAGTFDKFEELTRLREAGISVPLFSVDGAGLAFPILGRKRHHSKAKDIIPILQNDREFEWRKAGGASDYFVQYIPLDREFRVWGYRRRPLATYEKVLSWPDKYKHIGRNFDNGFAFAFMAEPPGEAETLGCAAIQALGLDFGAADILLGKDGRYYVLEVNTAPGVQGPRQCIVNLAQKIAKWEQLGFPRRAK